MYLILEISIVDVAPIISSRRVTTQRKDGVIGRTGTRKDWQV